MSKFSAQQQSQLAQIGAFLRESRESQGKSLEDIAIRTYIRPQLLGGIEIGDPGLLPEPIFVQGFIRRYAENLGLNGVELAQQFSVDSIPATPRPARPAIAEDSPTTRLTRISNREAAKESSANRSAEVSSGVAGASIFSAGSVSPLEDSLVESNRESASSEKPAAETTLIVDDAVLDMMQADAESSPAADSEQGLEEQGLEDQDSKGRDLETPLSPALGSSSSDSPSFPGSFAGLGTDASLANDLPTADLPTADLPTTGDVFGDKIAEFDRQNLQETETSSESTFVSGGVNSAVGVPDTTKTSSQRFDDDLPAAFTTAAATPAPKTSATPVSPTYVNREPVGVEYGETEGPNLKPFIIGGVAAALLTAVVVALASVFGGDRTPVVADSPAPPAQTELETIDTETLAPVDAAPVEPPASTAPIYVEAEATAEAWVSVIADGNTLFEGTLQPGETALWEGQDTISVYSGDAGALEVSQNGEAATVMGERGQPQEQIFTLN